MDVLIKTIIEKTAVNGILEENNYRDLAEAVNDESRKDIRYCQGVWRNNAIGS